MTAKPLIAIVGRPNVGKSTLFNRIIGRRKAIDEKEYGVTRDRLYEFGEWLGKEFILIDTGGLTYSDGGLSKEVHRQAEIAIEEADVILFIVDGKEGINVLDEEIADKLRQTRKKVVLTVNKTDAQQASVHDFFALGLGEPVPVSAVHGKNIGDLLDMLVEDFPPPKDTGREEKERKVAVVGRPNAGKSSLINKILGRERVIVHHEPGTTRDAIHVSFSVDNLQYAFVDTAGVRKKKNIHSSLEYYSILRSFKAIDEAHVCLLLIDAAEGIKDQDKKIAGYVNRAGKGLIILFNKWDLITLREAKRKELLEETQTGLKFVSFAPVFFISAATGKGLEEIFTHVNLVYQHASTRLPTGELNKILETALLLNPPPFYQGGKGKIFYWTQVSTNPPEFILFVNDPLYFHFSYLRYLENQLRRYFSFTGTPLRFTLRKRSRKEFVR